MRRRRAIAVLAVSLAVGACAAFGANPEDVPVAVDAAADAGEAPPPPHPPAPPPGPPPGKDAAADAVAPDAGRVRHGFVTLGTFNATAAGVGALDAQCQARGQTKLPG